MYLKSCDMINKITKNKYDEIVKSVEYFINIHSHGYSIDVHDVTHSVILNKKFQVNNYKHLVVGEIYREIEYLKSICKIEILDYKPLYIVENLKQCVKCFDFFRESHFQRKLMCRKCYRNANKDRINKLQRDGYNNLTEDQKKRRRKYCRDYYKNLTEDQKEHKNKLQRDYYKNMTEDQKERLREYNREYRKNLTEDQKERRRKYYRDCYNKKKRKNENNNS